MEPNRHWSFVFGGEAAVRPRVPTLHVFWTVLRCSEEREICMVCGHSPEIEPLRCDESVDEELSIIHMSSVFPAKTRDAKNMAESTTGFWKRNEDVDNVATLLPTYDTKAVGCVSHSPYSQAWPPRRSAFGIYIYIYTHTPRRSCPLHRSHEPLA